MIAYLTRSTRHSSRSLRTVLRPARRRLCSSVGSTPPPSSVETAEVLWPIGAGAVLVTGVLLGGIALRSDRPIRRLHSWVDAAGRHASADQLTFSWILRVAIAFGLTQLPADSLRQRQVSLGALTAWGGLLGSFENDYEQQAIALAALCALLDSEASVDAFRRETSWYDALVGALPALVHESSQALEMPEILVDTLSLCCTAASHPMFTHTPNDAWLWERLLEQSAASVPYEPDAALFFACLAATLAEKHDVALAMLRNAEVKRALVHLAESDADDGVSSERDGASLKGGGRGSSLLRMGSRASSGAGSVSPSTSWDASGAALDGAAAAEPTSPAELELAYARLALHKLALTAEGLAASTELSTEERLEIDEPFVRTYREHVAPPLPARPPQRAFAPSAEEQIALSILSVATCALGGVVWGAVAGALATARARRPVWRSALLTAAGAAFFETLMQTKLALLARARARGVPEATSAIPPPYATLRALVLTTSVDLGMSCAALHALVQPNRVPLAFGGWLIGRGLVLSQELLSVDIIEEVVEERPR
jgi:hypothetical protein